jgi:hypothetical protein
MLLPHTFSIGKRLIPVDWDFLGSMTSLTTFSVVVGGVVFAYREYVQSEVQRKREEAESAFYMYKEMNDRLMNPESLTARRWVILNLPTLDEMNNDRDAWLARINKQVHQLPKGSKDKRAPGQEYIKRILIDFDFIGFVDENYWKMEGELAEWMSSPVVKVWERIGVYVEEEAARRNEPDYYISARNFGKYCMEWRNKNQRPKPIVIPNGT